MTNENDKKPHVISEEYASFEKCACKAISTLIFFVFFVAIVSVQNFRIEDLQVQMDKHVAVMEDARKTDVEERESVNRLLKVVRTWAKEEEMFKKAKEDLIKERRYNRHPEDRFNPGQSVAVTIFDKDIGKNRLIQTNCKYVFTYNTDLPYTDRNRYDKTNGTECVMWTQEIKYGRCFSGYCVSPPYEGIEDAGYWLFRDRKKL